MFLEDDDFPPLEDGGMPMAAEDAELTDIQEKEDRRTVWLVNNGREDDTVGGMPAWWYKVLYIDKP